AAGVLLGACSSSDDDPAPAATNPPPTTPPPSNPPGIPPLDATVVSLDDGHRVGTVHWPSGNTSTGGQGGDVGDFRCTASSPNTMHEHAHLSIFLNGTALALPHSIGFVEMSPTSKCQYWIHTHDESGVI